MTRVIFRSSAGTRGRSLIGKQMGLVTVRARVADNDHGYPMWLVECVCGDRRVMRGCVLNQNPPRTHRGCTNRAKDSS